MKKTILLITAALMLTACGSSSNTDRVDYAAPAQDTITYTAEDAYLLDVHQQGGSVTYNVTDDELVQMGHEICSLLDEGSTVYDLAAAIAANDTGDQAAVTAVTAVTAAAIVNFCPEYRNQMN